MQKDSNNQSTPTRINLKCKDADAISMNSNQFETPLKKSPKKNISKFKE